MDDSAPARSRRRAFRRDNREDTLFVLLSHTENAPRVLTARFTDTEIDWTTYMQQIAIFLKGERDYKNIAGSTGPLVYPGAHVWIYKQLYKWTDEGRDIALAQYIFAGVYLLTLGVVFQCYRKARVSISPFWLLMLEADILIGSTVHFPAVDSFKAHA